MLIDHALRNKPGVATDRRSVKLENHQCPGRFDFDIVYYVNIDDWPEFLDAVRSGQPGTIQCDVCGIEATMESPVIAEFPSRNLLIFVTHGGDDGGAVLGFFAWFEKAVMLLPDAVIRRARQRPFTIVHGWQGLIALADVFKGRSLPPPPTGPRPGHPHPLDYERSFTTLTGYKYGDLFFYRPAQSKLDDLVSALLNWSSYATEASEITVIVETMEGIVSLVGAHHPWLTQELGRLHFEMGHLDQATTWLHRAAKAQHSWLAVTASFLDATPTTRADHAPQAPALPHALPASALSDVTQNRHVVLRDRPAVQDYDLWHFPLTEQHAYPDDYTMEALLAARGLALGVFDRINTDERAGVPWYPLSTASIHSDTMKEIQMLKTAVGYIDFSSNQVIGLDTTGAIRGFWRKYIEARWIFNPATRMEDYSSWSPSVMDAIDALLSAASAGEGDQVERYFLTEARQEIQRISQSR